MRLTAAGQLCINGTSVNNAGYLSIDFNGQSQQGIVLDDTYTSGGGAYMIFRDYTGANAGYITHPVQTSIGLIAVNYLQLGGGSAESMRIDSSGNVGINTTNPDYGSYGATERILGITGVATYRGRLSLQNTSTGTTGAAGTVAFFNGSTLLGAIDVVADVATNQGLFDFNTNNGTTTTSRLRISSVGNVSIGTTSALNTGVFSVLAAASRQGSTFQATTDSYWPILCWNLSAGSTSLLLFQSGSGGATVGSITYNGSLTLYNTTSDQRLKTNIVDAPSGNIDDIKVRSFDWIENGNHQSYGMIAQELNEVAPYAVHQPQSPDEMMGVDYSKLVPMMIKEIQDLKQRIATLENK
jgi:hypothetical protein